MGGQIFISEGTLDACGPILRISDQMEVAPKGVKKPITIYEVVGIGGEFNLFFPEKQEMELFELKKLLPVRFSILTGKYVGEEVYKGKVFRLSTRGAEIQANISVNRLANLRISLFHDEAKDVSVHLYAKVTEHFKEPSAAFRVN